MLTSEYYLTMYDIFLIKYSEVIVFCPLRTYLLKNVRQMENLKTNKLKRKICIRLTEEDYMTLDLISHKQQVNVSKLLRNLIWVVLDMVKEKNNIKN